MDNSGLVRVRTMMSMSRRDLMKGAAALGRDRRYAGSTTRDASAAGAVSMFGWQDYDAGLRVGDFLQREGIEVSFTPIGNNDEIISRLSAGGAGQIDIVTPYMGYIPFMVAADLLEPIDESLVPNLANVPEVFRNDSNVIVNGKRYAVPFTWGSGPMAYDPAVIPTAPESWMDIFKPEYKGKVGMMDDPIGNQMLAAILATDAEVPTMLTADQLDQATEFLIKLKKDAVRQLAVSWGELANALARSEVVITFSGGEFLKKFAAMPASRSSSPIRRKAPSPGSTAIASPRARRISRPRTNAPIRSLDVDGQVAFGEKTFQAIVVREAVDQAAAFDQVALSLRQPGRVRAEGEVLPDAAA